MSKPNSTGLDQEAHIVPQRPKNSSAASKKKRKKSSRPKPSATHQTQRATLRRPNWAYIHLEHLDLSQSASIGQVPSSSLVTTTTTTTDLDAVTAHLHLTSALQQFLGLHGAAIPFDILKLQGNDVWVRVPAEDRSAVVAAVGGWTGGNGNREGWTVKGWSYWDARVVTGLDAGQDLFDD